MNDTTKTFSLSDLNKISYLENKDTFSQNTLSFRLKIALKSTNISQSQLARSIGVKPQVIQYLCQKNIMSSRFTYLIAESLGINHAWLAAGVGTIFPVDSPDDKQYKIPLFSMNDCDDYFEGKQLDTNHIKHIFTNTSPNNLALIVEDTSMEPRFEKGTILIVDRNSKYQDNDFVIAKIKKYNSYIFRQLKISENITKLTPLNHDMYKEIVLSDQDHIIGSVAQTICNYQRD